MSSRNGIAIWLTISLLVKRVVTFGIHVCVSCWSYSKRETENTRIRQQAAMFVLKERLLYYRATDAVNEICLKRVIANAKKRTNIIHAAMMALMVANLPLRQDKTQAKVSDRVTECHKITYGVHSGDLVLV